MNKIIYLFFLFNFLLSESIISGCLDPLAKNYNPNATEDDGSCLFEDKQKKVVPLPKPQITIFGCIDELACNYNSEAVEDDNSCKFLDLCGICGGDNLTCIGCMDSVATNFDYNAIIDDRLLCEYDLVFDESKIEGYTDRDFTKLDYTMYFNYTYLDGNFDIILTDFTSPGISFGYEGDIYKKKNFMLSFGTEFMLSRKYDSENLSFSLHSIYFSPIINFQRDNAALYTKFGYNWLNSDDDEPIFTHFQSGDGGFVLGFGLVFMANDIRMLFDYNLHQLNHGDNHVGFHRLGITIYHKLISKLRTKINK